MREKLAACKAMTEAALAGYFPPRDDLPQRQLLRAMWHSLSAGGKRIRAALVLGFCEACGGTAEQALAAACAVEMLHTYSLIHDDLPCMDDDDLRRGKPACHIAFGEFTAVLAGDALQAEAFGAILRADMPAERRVQCAEILADAAGVDGICGGQQLDLEWEGRALTEDELTEISSRKTAALITAACRMGVACAGGGQALEDAAAQYGAAVGMAFQMRDDMLNALGDEKTLGKPVGTDARENKTTFLTLYGAAECQRMVERLTEHASTLAGQFTHPEFLIWLAGELAGREV